MNKISRFNDWLGAKITNAVATMWCAYGFTALALISLPAAFKTHSTVIIVAWVAQTFLQLVLLSIILVGQKLQSEKHDTVIDTLNDHHELLKDVHATLKEL
jgi:hypothetical protein